MFIAATAKYERRDLLMLNSYQLLGRCFCAVVEP